MMGMVVKAFMIYKCRCEKKRVYSSLYFIKAAIKLRYVIIFLISVSFNTIINVFIAIQLNTML